MSLAGVYLKTYIRRWSYLLSNDFNKLFYHKFFVPSVKTDGNGEGACHFERFIF